jgi:peptide/nickel transport system permease protein
MTDTSPADTAPARRVVFRQPMLVGGLALWIVLVLIAFLGELFWYADHQSLSFPRYAPPSPDHPLGTDILGGDMMALLIRGTRTSFPFALSVAAAATVIGAGLAAMAGAARRSGHAGVGRLVDAVLVALPVAAVVALTIGFTFDDGEYGRIRIVLSTLDWLWLAAIPLCVLVTMIVGALRRRPAPDTAHLIAANIALAVALVVMYEAWLPQYAVRPPEVSLGSLWDSNQNELSTHPALVLPTATMAVLIAVATYLLTAGLLAAAVKVATG